MLITTELCIYKTRYGARILCKVINVRLIKSRKRAEVRKSYNKGNVEDKSRSRPKGDEWIVCAK